MVSVIMTNENPPASGFLKENKTKSKMNAMIRKAVQIPISFEVSKLKYTLVSLPRDDKLMTNVTNLSLAFMYEGFLHSMTLTFMTS